MEVFIIAALTADGFIGQSRNQNSTHWTSSADQKFFLQKSQQAGVIIMGDTTYRTIGKPLPHRLNIIYTFKPKSIPLASNLRTTQASPQQLIRQLKKEGFKQAAVCGGQTIYSMFIKSGLVNKLYLTIEPILFGQGIKLFNQSLNINLKLVKTHPLSSQTLVLEYNLL